MALVSRLRVAGATLQPRSLAQWGLVVFLLALSGWLGSRVGFFAWDYDEGVYLAEAWWVARGEPLYTVVQTPLPPLLPWGVGGLFALLGAPSVTVARLLVVLCGVGGLAATAGIAHALAPRHRDVAALVAAAAVGLAPLWLTYSRLVLADVPALSLALGAVWSALRVWRDGRRRWLVLSGGLAAAAVLTKLSAVFLVPLLATVVLLRPGGTWRTWWRDGLALGGGAAGLALPVLLAVDLPAAYQAAVRYHLNVRSAWEGPPYSWRVLLDFVVAYAAWWLTAGIGLTALARRRRWREMTLLTAWLGTTLFLVLDHRPLWLHLLLPLLPPLGIAAGVGAGKWLAAERAPLARRRTIWAGAVGLALVWGASWFSAARLTRAALAPPSHVWHWETVLGAWLRETVPPDQFVITDDPMLVLRAGRLVPPSFTDTSYTRIRSGQLTDEDLIAEASRTRAAAVISWRDRFPLLPRWMAWVEAHYVLRCDYGPHRRVYVRPDLAQRVRQCPGP